LLPGAVCVLVEYVYWHACVVCIGVLPLFSSISFDCHIQNHACTLVHTHLHTCVHTRKLGKSTPSLPLCFLLHLTNVFHIACPLIDHRL
jgi:hypothetical protein